MKKIPSWLVVSGGCVGVIALLVAFLPIRQVECALNDQKLSIDTPVCHQLQALKGSRLLLRDFGQDPRVTPLLYVEQTKEIFPIQKTEQSLAGTVVFFLSDQPPLYRIQENGQVSLVTQAGELRDNNDQVTAPTVFDPALVYQRQSATVHTFLSEFLLGLGEQQSKVTQITLVSEERIEVRTPGFPIVLLELKQDPRRAAARLALLLTQLNPSSIDLAARELDLRFELPVLRTFESSDSAATIDSQE